MAKKKKKKDFEEEIENESFIVSFYRNHKVLVWLLIIVILFVVIMNLIVTDKKPVDPNTGGITLTIEPNIGVSLNVGSTYKLKAIINVDNPTLIWSSSDSSVATVDNGLVTGVNYGNAIITVTYYNNDGNKYSATNEIVVSDGNPSVVLNRIKFPDGDLYMPINGEYKLPLEYTPANGYIDEKVFTSSNPNVVTVSQEGMVKAINSGYASVSAIVNGKLKTTIDVYVNANYIKSEIVNSPTSITFTSSNRKMKVGNSEKLSYIVSPSNANSSQVTWSSSDSSIVKVDQTGRIEAIKEGTAIISILTFNGKRDDLTVEVYNDIVEVESIIIASDVINLETGKTQVITPEIVPSNASNKGLIFSSDDPSTVSISVNNTGTSATLSALKKGNTTVTIKSGNIEKKIVVNVTGGNNNDIDEDDSNLPTTIKVRSDKNNLAKSYEEAKKIPVAGTTTVSVTMSVGVGKIKYCINKYGSTSCTPNVEMLTSDTISIPSGDMYVLRVKKYDYNDKEISSTSKNYIDGVLNYYINTKADIEPGKYTVANAYTSTSAAISSSNKLNDKVTIKVTDSSRHLYICYTSGCTPNIRVNSSYTINLNSLGLWYIYIIEYDKDNNKIGNTTAYYSYVKNETNVTSTPKASDVQFKATNLKIIDDNKNGKYLSFDMESNINFNNIRFCYTVVNKNSIGTCNLDTTSTSVPYYNNGSIIRPKTSLNTYYANVTSTSKKTFNIYLDALDDLFNNNDTNKDVIFEFALKTSMGFSDPIGLRINMTNKNGDVSYWSVKKIK